MTSPGDLDWEQREKTLRQLYARVKWACAAWVGMLLLVAPMKTQSGSGAILAHVIILAAMTVLAVSAVHIVVQTDYTPGVTPLLMVGGLLLFVSQLFAFGANLPVFSGLMSGGEARWHENIRQMSVWGGTGLLLASFYLSLVEAAVAKAGLERERAQLQLEVGQRKHTAEQLALARDLLEERVRTRTAELSAANQRLEQKIEEQRLTERALRHSEERFQHVAASTGEWIWELDRQGRYTYSSQAVQVALGFSPEEVLGKHYSEFVDPAQDSDAPPPIRELIASRVSFSNLVTRAVGRDGRRLWHESTGFPILDPEGNLLGFRGTSHDITEKKQLEEQMYEIRRMESLGQLAGGVAHDFNNLITVIMGCCESLKSLLSPEHEAMHVLAVLQEAAEQATNVTRSLLMFGEPRASNPKPTELGDSVRQSARLLRRLLPAGINLDVETDGQLPLWILADSQLQQVIMNLAVNARDAMPNGGDLVLSVTPFQEGDGPRMARLEIRDTGHGMSQEVQAAIFEPFFTTKPRGQGTGLGLAIVQSIVKDYGGTIKVFSEPDRGTTFSIDLPITDPPQAEELPLVSSPAHGQGEGILLAEDNPLIRGLLTSKLRTLGYEVLSVADGVELLQCHRQFVDRIRLLILDLDMPRLGGLDCLRELRLADKHTPAIVITAQADPELDSRLDEDTVLLRKPFNAAQLAELVSLTLKSRELAGREEPPL